MSDTGLITTPSRHNAATTLDRLRAAIAARGLAIFATFDHAANAIGAGMALRPTTVLVFGNPQGGTLLMQASQPAGLDLPLKMLVWEDAAGTAFLTWNDPHWIAARHQLPSATTPPVEAMAKLLHALAEQAGGA
jgi:uncharacterized protein (DUF302 family)